MTGLPGPAARVGADLTELLTHVADVFGLGSVRDWSVLTTGYEDCNIDLITEQARVVVKVFATDRATGIAARTADLITRAQAGGVRHPRLHRNVHGELVHHHGHQIMVMDFVHGHTFYELDRAPSQDELIGIIEQTVLIHTVAASPTFVVDPWAITNLVPLRGQVHDVLDTEQRHLVMRALAEIAEIDRDALPTALIHGDLTKGNLLLAEDGKINVLDFAVANRLPRIQELAVMAANLTHNSPDPLPARVETIAELYSNAAAAPLTAAELVALRAFTHAAAAMELLGALTEWHCQGNRSQETEYLIDLGLAGLRDYAMLS